MISEIPRLMKRDFPSQIVVMFEIGSFKTAELGDSDQLPLTTSWIRPNETKTRRPRNRISSSVPGSTRPGRSTCRVADGSCRWPAVVRVMYRFESRFMGMTLKRSDFQIAFSEICEKRLGFIKPQYQCVVSDARSPTFCENSYFFHKLRLRIRIPKPEIRSYCIGSLILRFTINGRARVL